MKSKSGSMSRRGFLGAAAVSGAMVNTSMAAAQGKAAELVIHTDRGKETISRHLYGHFSEHLGRCIYGGYWVGEDSRIPNVRGIRTDIVDALKKIRIPNLRWPGGCFADYYHWKDGVGPKSERPEMLNLWWGEVLENNHFGTHEFMDLCEQLETEPYVAGNVGSGTVREMQQWVEYLTASKGPMADWRRSNGRAQPWRVQYWGVGNENWGCGGRMRPEVYADLYRQYSNYVRDFGDNKMYRIAGGANRGNYTWTEVMMREAKRFMQGLSVHYYTSNRHPKLGLQGSATHFKEDEWMFFLKAACAIDELMKSHSEIMDDFDPEKQVGMVLDEWGSWYAAEPGTNPRFLYQQNSLRDALIAGIHLNIFNGHCERLKMANIAQTINVLQAMILTDNEKMLLTPSYHVFDMYQDHQDATLLPVDLDCGEYTYGKDALPALNASASRSKSGKILLTLCHLDPNRSCTIQCRVQGAGSHNVAGRILTADTMTAHNTFDRPNAVEPRDFTGVTIANGGLTVEAPPMSVIALTIG